MAKYINGINTKENILNACKELFYIKGYNETTFMDICKKANVNKSSIHYHFSSKENLLLIIYREQVNKYKVIAEKLLDIHDDPYLIFVLITRFYWYLFLKDEKYREFCIEAQRIIPLTRPEDYYHIYLKQSNLISETFDNSDLSFKLNVVSSGGIDLALSLYIKENLDKFNYKMIYKYVEELYPTLFSIDIERYKKIMKRADLILVDFKWDSLDSTFY